MVPMLARIFPSSPILERIRIEVEVEAAPGGVALKTAVELSNVV